MKIPARRLASCLAAVLWFALFTPAAMAIEPVNSNLLGQAIRGYDPVAYFQDGKPSAGSSQYIYQWQGATWRFVSQANLDAFKAQPEKFAPQYGGYCAYAVSKGSTAGIDPNAWAIHEGKLYLNNSPGVHRKWLQNIAGHVQRADSHWPKLLAAE